MPVDKNTVAQWLDRMAAWMMESEIDEQIEPLLVAYATAATQAGVEKDLIDRIWQVAGADPKSRGEARELRVIANEIRKRSERDQPRA